MVVLCLGFVSACYFAEQIYNELAGKLDVSPETLREANLYQEGQTTPYGRAVTPCYVGETWNKLKVSSDFVNRSAEIDKFNSVSRLISYLKSNLNNMEGRDGNQSKIWGNAKWKLESYLL